MKPELVALLLRELEHEIFGKAIAIPPYRLIQYFGLDLIKIRECGIKHHAMTAQNDNRAVDHVQRCERLCMFGGRFHRQAR